ncbi:6005_t:CDS:2 [Entrophospora sp. SA101]|nr:6005_t:CDS:2 [Entrophospora sp. SA101]
MENSDKSNNENNNTVAQEKEQQQSLVVSTAVHNNNNIILPTILENDDNENLLTTIVQSPTEFLPPQKTLTTTIIEHRNSSNNLSPNISSHTVIATLLTTSHPNSRSNSPSSNNNNHSSTPIISKVSQSLQTNDDLPEMKPIKEPLTSSNFIHIGIPAEINFPSANIKETIVGVFHIFNPKDNPVSWSLKPASVATFRRLGTSTTAAIKLDEEVFSVRRPSGYLKAKNAVRVDVHFLPTGVGTYMQTFVLEDAADGEATSAVGMKFQGIATENTFSALLQKKRLPRKELKFEVEGTELKMPPTRIGRQRTMGIKIINVSKESIRLNCKCETISGPGGKFVLSIAMNTVIVKADGFAVILVRFQPKTSGEVKGVVTIQSLGSAEVKTF